MSFHQQVRANIKFDKLLNEIREKPDFENFLGRLGQEDIRGSARDGPVVVLSASEFRGVDAILVGMDGIRVLRFPEISIKEPEVRSQNPGSLELAEWLWDATVKRIMHALGLAQPPPAGNALARMRWIPTGILRKFPLHAAGPHLTSTDTVMDRAIPSYSSSIKALLRVRRRPYSRDGVEQFWIPHVHFGAGILDGCLCLPGG